MRDVLAEHAGLVRYLLSLIPGNALAFIGIAAVFGGCWAIGRWCVGERVEASLVGWALLYLVAVVAALFGIGLVPVAWVFIAVAVVLFARAPRPSLPWLLIVPVAGLALVMPMLHWDSFMHWLPNSAYLYRYDRFPVMPLEGFPSAHPTYPPAIPMMHYLASWLTGGWREAAGLFLNVGLSLVALLCVVGVMDDGKRSALSRYLLPVLGFGAVMALNPAWREINYWSAVADPAIGVVALVVIVQWARLMTAERAGALLSLFLLGVLLAGMKHSGWVLAVVLGSAGALVGVCRGVPWRQWALPAVALVTGALVADLLWATYLALYLDVGDQFSIQTPTAWRWDMVPSLLMGVWADVLIFPTYYAAVGAVTALGLVSLRRNVVSAEISAMLGFAAVAMVLHLGSLFAGYIGTGFSEREIASAASLQRYSAHVGFAVCAIGLVALIMAVRPHADGLRSRLTPRRTLMLSGALYAVPLALTVFVPSAFRAAGAERSDRVLRQAAAVAAEAIPSGESVVVVGSRDATNFAKYESWRPGKPEAGPNVLSVRRVSDSTAAKREVATLMEDSAVSYVWLLDVPAGEFSVVWSRKHDKWRVLN